ncbi:MAG: MFS transporter [Chloroflexota bacterium]
MRDARCPSATLMKQTQQPTRWRIADYLDLGIIGATHGLSDGFSGMLKPVLVLIVVDLGLSTFEAGTLLSAFSVATFLFLYPISLLADYGGRKKEILLVGLTITTLAFLGMQWSTTFGTLAILAFLAGMGNATFHPCGTALTTERFPHNRSFAVSFFSMMGNAGASFMPAIQALIATAVGWRLAITISTSPALLLLPLMGIRFQNQTVASETESLKAAIRSMGQLTQQVLRNRSVVLLATIYALAGMASSIVTGFLSLLARDTFSFDIRTVGFALTTYYFAGALAKPIMGYLYDRWGARTSLITPLLLSGVLTLAVTLTPWEVSFIPLVALLGITVPISPIILTAAADRSAPEVMASSVGLIYTCYGLGFISPLIGGWLAELSSLSVSYLFAAFLFWIGASITLLLPKQGDNK